MTNIEPRFLKKIKSAVKMHDLLQSWRNRILIEYWLIFPLIPSTNVRSVKLLMILPQFECYIMFRIRLENI